jgi:hypothetical protein
MTLLMIPLILLLSGCQTATSEKGFTDISVAELGTMLESKDFLFVNTHIPYEGEIAARMRSSRTTSWRRMPISSRRTRAPRWSSTAAAGA